MEQKEVLAAVLEAIKGWNELADAEHRLDLAPGTLLLGSSSKLDSLGVVNLILLVEEKVAARFGTPVTLTDERTMLQEPSPFRSVQALTDYVYLLLTEK
jgi:acyl carrier protein